MKVAPRAVACAVLDLTFVNNGAELPEALRGAAMIDRTELLEAALDSRPDGIALLDAVGQVVFWNRAAELITGYASIEVLARPIPAPLGTLLSESALQENLPLGSAPPLAYGALVHARHKLGHTVPAIARRVMLRNGIGEHIGMAVAFHPVESLDALPNGETGEELREIQSRADLEDRMQAEFEDFSHGGPPFGVLWIGIDQAQEMQRTHGADACRVMLDKVRRAVARGLRPTEEMGYWGDGEFLVLAHERTAEMFLSHGQTLAGLARTADFRWWGDRISLTVSIGVAQACRQQDESLQQLLHRARHAMEASSREGGNRTMVAGNSQTTASSGDSICSRS
jgi:diguanylate cyclase (GGDEF)-like protein/PAS domain S-box-containing protein